MVRGSQLEVQREEFFIVVFISLKNLSLFTSLMCVDYVVDGMRTTRESIASVAS